jgi:hypothetical protein
MSAILRLFLILVPAMRRLGVCSIVGIPAWSAPYVLNGREAAIAAVMLTAFAALVVLFILCIPVRLAFRSVALPALFNCFLTCLLTVFVARALNAYAWSWLLGMVIGASVGGLLCRINYVLHRRSDS